MRGSRYQGEGRDLARSSGRPGSNSSSRVSTRGRRLPEDPSGGAHPWQDVAPVTAAGRLAPDVQAGPPAPGLLRSLGAMDGALITIGASVGSGIFLTTGDIAQRCP